MNYEKLYFQLVASARNRQVNEGYTEKHHVIPSCMGGTSEPENLVSFTAKEHFLAHLLLSKIYPDRHGLLTAATLMGAKKITGSAYSYLREKFARNQSVRYTGSGNPNFGKVVSEQTRKAISAANIGRKSSPEVKAKLSLQRKNVKHKTKRSKSETYKLMMSEKMTGAGNFNFGRVTPDHVKEKISNSTKGRISPRKGITLNEELKEKLSCAAKNRAKFQCSCGVIATKSNLARWHNKCQTTPGNHVNLEVKS